MHHSCIRIKFENPGAETRPVSCIFVNFVNIFMYSIELMSPRLIFFSFFAFAVPNSPWMNTINFDDSVNEFPSLLMDAQ